MLLRLFSSAADLLPSAQPVSNAEPFQSFTQASARPLICVQPRHIRAPSSDPIRRPLSADIYLLFIYDRRLPTIFFLNTCLLLFRVTSKPWSFMFQLPCFIFRYDHQT